MDFSLFRKMAPDHQPRVTLADSVARLRDGLEAIGFADKDFRTSQQIRLKVLDRHMGRAASARICAGRAPIEKGGSNFHKGTRQGRGITFM